MGDIEKIEKSDDIINILLEYVETNFNRFEHQSSSEHPTWETKHWWWNTHFWSWSPFVEACFIRFGEGEDRTNPRYKIFFCVEDPTQLIKWMGASYHKYDCKNSDIDLLDKNTNEFVLSLEHSENVPNEEQIRNYKTKICYRRSDDRDVEGDKTKKQLIAVRHAVWKLKQFDSKFKVVTSRPKLFDKINENDNPSYIDSVKYFRDRIEKDLMDADSLKDDETWLIILIAPKDSSLDSNADEIIFYCYEWDNTKNCLRQTQISPIPVKKDGDNKWIIDNERMPS